MAFFQSRPEESSVQPIDYSFAPHDSGVSFADCSVGSPESTGHSSGSELHSDAEIHQKSSELSPAAFSPKNEPIENIEPNSSSSPILNPVQIPASEYPVSAELPVQPAEPAQFQNNYFYETPQNHLFPQFDQSAQPPICVPSTESQMLPVRQSEEPPVKRRRTDNRKFFYILQNS